MLISYAPFLSLILLAFSTPVLSQNKLDYDTSCNDDAIAIWENAFQTISTIIPRVNATFSMVYQKTVFWTDTGFSGLDSTQMWDIYRISALLTAFFVSPWQKTNDQASPMTPQEILESLKRKPDSVAFGAVMDSLRSVLQQLVTSVTTETGIAWLPRIFCGVRLRDAGQTVPGVWPAVVLGSFLKFTGSAPDGREIGDTNNPERPNWQYLDEMGNDGDDSGPIWLNEGVEPCRYEEDFTFMAIRTYDNTPYAPYILFCDATFKYNVNFNRFPSIDHLMDNYTAKLPSENLLDHYRDSDVGRLLEALFMSTIDNAFMGQAQGQDEFMNLFAPGYVAATKFAQSVAGSDIDPVSIAYDLSRSANNVVEFIIAAALANNDWSLFEAESNPFSQLSAS